MKIGRAVVLACVLGPALAPADEVTATPTPEDTWTGKGQAGYTASQGNSQAKSANAAVDAAYVDGPWKHAARIDGLYGESAGLVSAERWDAQWQSNYALTPVMFVFGSLRYERDLFSGFQYQAATTGGAGYQVFASNAVKLSVQLGLGYRELRPETLQRNAAGAVIARLPQPAQGGVVETAGLAYSQLLSNTTTLSDKLLVESGSNDTLVTDSLALAVKISTKLALSVGYNLQHNSAPPAGLKKIDTLETVNLVYSF